MSRSTRELRVIVVSHSLSDEDRQLEKEGLVRRRLVATTGVCPCGAVLELPRELRPGVHTVRVEHEHDCPAIRG